MEDSEELLAPRSLFTLLIGRNIPPVPLEQLPNAEYNSTWYSRLTWSWLTELMTNGYKRTLQETDLYQVADKCRSDVQEQRFSERYQYRQQQYKLKKEKKKKKDGEEEKHGYWPLVQALFDVLWRDLALATLYNFLFGTAGIFISYLVKLLVQFATDSYLPLGPKPPVGAGIGYAFGLTALAMITSLFHNQFTYTSTICGARVRGTLSSTIHSKFARLSPRARLDYAAGNVNSLVTIDSQKIDLCLMFLSYAFTLVPSMAIGLVILITTIGPAGLIGVAVIIAGVASTVYLSKINIDYRKKVVKFTVERVETVKEVLDAIRLVKLYAWENAYFKRISDTRKREEKNISRIALINAFMNSLAQSLSYFACLVTFLVFVKLGHPPAAAKMFSTLTIFNVIGPNISILPRTFSLVGDAMVSLDRINKFLNAEEDVSYVEIDENLAKQGLAVKVRNGKFSWGNAKPDEEKLYKGFDDLNLDIKRGELVVIAGGVGSGKSTLLAALTGKLINDSESSVVSLSSAPAMCMEYWSLNATIRDNIVFHRPFDQEWYDKVVHACCLIPDFENFPNGDLTVTGESGVTLSGGQKARVALARAVYSDADIYIFEDVLSAVDPHVAGDMIDKCLSGLLRGKTVLIATHQLQLAIRADSVVFLQNQDGYSKVTSGTLADLLAQETELNALVAAARESKAPSDSEDDVEKQEEVDLSEEELLKDETIIDIKRVRSDSEFGEFDALIEKEDRATNAVNFKVYLKYLLASGTKNFLVTFPLFLISFLAFSVGSVMISVWVGWWSDNRFNQRPGFYMGIYGGMVGPIMVAGTAFLFFNRLNVLQSNSAIHNKAVTRMLRAPMSFFNANPIGRILNRFTRDMDSLDNEIAIYTMILFYAVGNFFSTFILVCINAPVVMPIVVPVLFMFYLGVGFYRKSAREVKRLDALLRSSMMTKLNETLNGMNVITSYGKETVDTFHRDFNASVDKMNSASFLTHANQAWLGFRIELAGCLFTFTAAILIGSRALHLNPGDAGIVVTLTVSVIEMLSIGLQGFAELENCMNSAERLFYYAEKIPQERFVEPDPSNLELERVPKDWPPRGSIKFNDASMRYKPSLPRAMKSVSVEIKGGEKVGICGRTGAGKSSILLTLFRIIELCDGSMSIDGTDISKLALHDLRKRMAIIPQDPVLFKGTVRFNLDPLGEYSDARLHAALFKCGVYNEKETNSNQQFALDREVEHNGANFSQGEKQLLALARALVRNTRILVLDEATSNVDYVTDGKIQSILASEFEESTVLCVAHRLKTIIKYDKIMVLDAGELIEFGSPLELFKQGGHFHDMCIAADIEPE